MYKIIHRNDGVLKEFRTEFELIKFLNGYNWNLNKKYNINDILGEYCHNWNDWRWKINNHNLEKLSFREEFNLIFYPEKHYFTLMLIDPYGRIMNIPDFAAKMDRTIIPANNYYYNYEHIDSKIYALYKKRTPNFIHIRRRYYRQLNVQGERKISFDPMHAPYVRPKRRAHFLDPWEIESDISMQPTWKNLKIRKQWMENLK